MTKWILNGGTGELEAVKGTENDPPTLGEKILAKGFKDNPLPPDNMKTVKQLENLRAWSVDPLKYVENINRGKSYGEALKNSKYINNPKKLEKFIKEEDPIYRGGVAPLVGEPTYKKVKKKPKDMIVPKIDISPLLVPRREVPIIPKELQVKRDPDLDKGLGNFYKKQFRFDE
jgi:hypothetical protein